MLRRFLAQTEPPQKEVRAGEASEHRKEANIEVEIGESEGDEEGNEGSSEGFE